MIQRWEPGGPAMPTKHAPLRLVDDAEPAGARPGQVLVMFAIFALGMLGMLGLATDVGYTMAARRAVQGAADAGAIAGARVIARYTSTAPTAAQSEVASIVTSNHFGPETTSLYTCEYIGDNWGVVGNCNVTVPSSASGARVRTRLTHDTFFIRVLPGAPDSVTVAGYAKARVQKATITGESGPFIVCGYSAWDVTSDPTTSNGGVNTTIVDTVTPFKIKPSVVGKTFRIWDNKLGNKNANCDLDANSFKGLADQDENEDKVAPDWFIFKTGSTAGPTREKVRGTQGCDAGAEEPYNCVMMLPIATNSPVGDNSAKTIRVIGYASFYVTVFDSNSANGVLIDDFIVAGSGTTTGWCRDCGGPVVIRLIW